MRFGAAFAIFGLLAVLSTRPAGADPRGTVSGRVVDDRTGAAIAGASVSVYATRAVANGRTEPPLAPLVTTRRDGSFSVIAIDEDRIVVAIESAGFGPMACPYVLAPGGETRVTFRLRKDEHATACPIAPVGGGQTQDVYIVR